MLKEALSVRCTVCDWSSAGRPPAPTRRRVAGTTGADLGHYTAAGFVAARPEG